MLSNGEWSKHVVIFGVDNSSSVHAHNKQKDILVLGGDSTDTLDGVTITAEVKCFINIVKSKKQIFQSLHYNGRNSFLYVDGVKIYQLKNKTIYILFKKYFERFYNQWH